MCRCLLISIVSERSKTDKAESVVEDSSPFSPICSVIASWDIA